MNHHARRQFGDAVAEAETRDVARLRAENAEMRAALDAALVSLANFSHLRTAVSDVLPIFAALAIQVRFGARQKRRIDALRAAYDETGVPNVQA